MDNFEVYVGNRLEFACNNIMVARQMAYQLHEEDGVLVEICDKFGHVIESLERVTRRV